MFGEKLRKSLLRLTAFKCTRTKWCLQICLWQFVSNVLASSMNAGKVAWFHIKFIALKWCLSADVGLFHNANNFRYLRPTSLFISNMQIRTNLKYCNPKTFGTEGLSQQISYIFEGEASTQCRKIAESKNENHFCQFPKIFWIFCYFLRDWYFLLKIVTRKSKFRRYSIPSPWSLIHCIKDQIEFFIWELMLLLFQTIQDGSIYDVVERSKTYQPTQDGEFCIFLLWTYQLSKSSQRKYLFGNLKVLDQERASINFS